MSISPTPPLFLPITQAAAADFFERNALPALAIERAALFACLLQLAGTAEHAALERLLASSQQAFEHDPAAGHRQLQQLRERAAAGGIAEIVRRLAASGLCFAPEEVMAQRAWSDDQGRYAFNFQQACRGMLETLEIRFHAASQAHDPDTDDAPEQVLRRAPRIVQIHGSREQTVVANIIAAARDEHIAVDAYAGTGKTHLIHTLANSLGNAITYIAPSQAHLHGFHSHAASSGHPVRVTTLWQLAHELCRAHARTLGMKHAPRHVRSLLSASQQAEVAGIDAIAGSPREAVLHGAQRAISRWCHSDDEQIGDRHFQHGREISPEQRAAHLQAARRLWQAMFSAPVRGGHPFDININHLAKWLLQTGAGIPPLFGLLMVDEAHDLQPAWARLFFRYQGGCVLLGDPHQRLQGTAMRATHAKRVTMAQSIRLGLGADELVQQTLALAPLASIDEPFSASRQHLTRQQRYARGNELPGDGLRIHGSEWALLADALRLREAGARFRLLAASRRDLQRLIPAALSLFRHGDVYRGLPVKGHRNWAAVATSLERQGRQDVLRLFERGFNERHLQQLIDAEASEDDSAITLALIDHAKNLEASRVLLMDSCFEIEGERRNYNLAHATYLALTRARNEIWLPGDAMERLGELQKLYV